jgi:hypothetical protein
VPCGEHLVEFGAAVGQPGVKDLGQVLLDDVAAG